MIKLVIDIGNTLTKFAVFNNQELIDIKVFEDIPQPPEINNYLQSFTEIKSAIVSSVKKTNEKFISFLNNKYQLIQLNDKTPIPILNNYKTKQTLGNDRLAAAVAGATLYPGNNVLVIQAGTCITYEFINAQGEYMGGAISPGIHMRYKAMNTFTGKLSLVEHKKFDGLIGQTTEESILSGVNTGIIAEVDGIISAYKSEYPDLTIILSGGDADFFVKQLKNSIFAVPNIVLKGLNIILDFNV